MLATNPRPASALKGALALQGRVRRLAQQVELVVRLRENDHVCGRGLQELAATSDAIGTSRVLNVPGSHG